MLPEFTVRQRAAFSFTALVKGDPQWRTLDWRRLSFTDPDWSPLCQLYGTEEAGLRRLGILPGCPAALGFTAFSPADAEELGRAWGTYAPPGHGSPVPALALKAAAPVPPFRPADAFRRDLRS